MVRVPRLPIAVATVAMAAPLVVGACGDDDRHENRDRPAVPIVITASISKDRVSVSPTRFGAGPIRLVVTNQTDRSQQITLETADEPGSSKVGVRQETGPINPRDTASLAADIGRGSYRVHVRGADIRPARLDVGDPRPSAQQDLLLP